MRWIVKPATGGSPEKYPVLMQHRSRDFIVMFSAPKVGTVVAANLTSQHKVGAQKDCWIDATERSEWLPFRGSVELVDG